MKREPTPAIPVHWVLWGSFTMAVLIYGGVGFMLRSQAEPVGGADGTTTLVMLMGLLAGFTASLLATLGTPLAAARIPSWQTWHILRLASAEAPALFGLAGFHLGASELGFMAMLAWSLGLMLLNLPSQRDREAWDAHKARLRRSERR